jgi:tRNA (guanine-N7-)-methyltransferase
MRMRRKSWARPELASCPFYIREPLIYKGRWSEAFSENKRELWLDLGCGKGRFAAEFSLFSPHLNLLGIDIKSEVLASAARTAANAFLQAGRRVDNLRLTAYDIERAGDILSPFDKVTGLFINFCNPWPKQRHQKHRLTHPRQLASYRKFLAPNARLFFKTDDAGLFDDTLDYLCDSGFIIEESRRDLAAEHPAARFQSEHELSFRDMKIPIGYICARMAAGRKTDGGEMEATPAGCTSFL